MTTLREQLPDPAVVHIAKGCHDDAFWRSVAPEQLRLIGDGAHAAQKRHKRHSSAARVRT